MVSKTPKENEALPERWGWMPYYLLMDLLSLPRVRIQSVKKMNLNSRDTQGIEAQQWVFSKRARGKYEERVTGDGASVPTRLS